MTNLYFGTSNYLHIEEQFYFSEAVLICSSLKIQRKLIETNYDTSLVTLFEKKRLTNVRK